MDRRHEQLSRLAPGWRQPGNGPTLYIGANLPRHDMFGLCPEPRDVVEVHGPYCDAIRAAERFPPFRRIYHRDVRELATEWAGSGQVLAPRQPRYGTIMWWHGPEHSPKSDAVRTIGHLQALAARVIVAMPHGDYPHGPIDDNPHQAHVSSWEVPDLEELGFRCDWYGRGKGSNLVGVWEVYAR